MARPGARVVHPEWGPGVLARLVNGGRHWVVRLDGRPNTPVVLPAREFLGALDVPLVPAPPPEPPEPRADARQALEALRLGVVPPRGLARLTVGRATERARLRSMADAARGIVVVSGEYGTGKTHLVELAEAEALAAGMLVARATFDPEEVPPSHPVRIYAALMMGLRYPEGTGRGLAPLFDRLAASLPHSSPEGSGHHRWLSPALWAQRKYPGSVLATLMREWLEGAPHEQTELLERLHKAGWRGPRPLALSDYRTFGQIMAHLLGGIASWAEDAGWRGLFVLLDEAEYFDHLDTTARSMAENVLRYLAIATLPNAELPFDSAQVYRGGQEVHRAVNPRYRADQPLAALCAFTPHPRIDGALSRVVRDSAILRLETLPPSSFGALADNVLAMVRDAAPDLAPNAAHEHLVKRALAAAWDSGTVTNTRQAARMLVEHWDLYRHQPERAVRGLRARGR